MDFEIYSYRFSKEIIEHPNYTDALNEITQIIEDCPLYRWPGKSSRNAKLDVVQQLLNAYFDVKFSCLNYWLFHPDATLIPNSGLKADFQKTFTDLTIQAEVQFGNMSRWYSDVFKFQTAYSQNMINMGLSIVPHHELGRRIDSNITNYERCIRELPSADLSITLPILMIGLKPGANTQIIDVSQSQFTTISDVTGRGNSDNLYRIVNESIANIPIQNISVNSPIGNRP
ncbi:MAG: BglII/BstYI family type II restriction endonuclease [Bacteroidota bacterium]